MTGRAARWFVPRPMPRKTALLVASVYTTLAVGWPAVGLFTVLGPVTAWFNVFCLVLWTANAAFYWIAYVRARRTQR